MGIFDEEIIPEKEPKSTSKAKDEKSEESISSPMMAGLNEIADLKKAETNATKEKKSKKTTKSEKTMKEKSDLVLAVDTSQKTEEEQKSKEKAPIKTPKGEKTKTKSSAKKSKVPA
jgi:hypothetical protein